MNRKDFKKIETIFDIKLPRWYKRFIINAFADIDKMNQGFYRKVFLTRPDEIIEINQLFRSRKFRRKNWNQDWFIIGGSPENFNFINLSYRDKNIYRIDKESKYNPDKLQRFICSRSIRKLYDMTHYIKKLVEKAPKKKTE